MLIMSENKNLNFCENKKLTQRINKHSAHKLYMI